MKTLETIKKNSFVIEYVGEVITTEEAERRGIQYGELIFFIQKDESTKKLLLLLDSEGRTYLFDLDFNDIDCAYSIDAATHGNVSHFINHSVSRSLL